MYIYAFEGKNCNNMQSENRANANGIAVDDFYAILSVKIEAL